MSTVDAGGDEISEPATYEAANLNIPPVDPDLVGVNARDLHGMILQELPADGVIPSVAQEKRLEALFRAYGRRRSMSPPEIRGQIDYENNPGLSVSELHGGQQ